MKKRLKHIILILISIVALSFITKVEVSTEPAGLYYSLSANSLEAEAGDTVEVTFSISNINSVKETDDDGIETMYFALEYDYTKFDIEMSATVGEARNISNNAISIPSGEALSDNVNINNLFIKNFDSHPGIIDISYLYFYATGSEWLHNDANFLTLKFTVKNDVSGVAEFKLLDEGVEVINSACTYVSLSDVYPDISTAKVSVNIKGPEAPTSTIYFNSFGVGNYPDLTLPIGETVNAPANPTKQGYSFDGWYESPDNGVTLSSTPYVFSTMPENNVYLYAKYTPINYSIKYNSNGGQGVMSSQVLAYDQTALLSNNLFTRTGYNFLGWSTSETGNIVYTNGASISNLLDTSGGIVNLYAVWQKVHDITLNPQGGLIDGSSSYTFNVIDNGTYGTNLKTPTKIGHTFLGWYTLQTGGIKVVSTTKVTSSLTLYAQWTTNTYTISFMSNGGSSVSDIIQTYNSTVIKPSDPTRTGYTFVGWYSDTALTNPVSFPYTMTDVNVTFYAKWQINQYTITFDVYGGTSVSSITKNYNDTITAPVAPTKTGYVFDGWYTDETFTTKYSFSKMPANDITLYAKWIEEHTVTFEYNNGSSQTSRIVLNNAAIGSLPSPTKVGYTFDGWYKTVDYSDSKVLSTEIITNSLTLYAKWNVKSITITFNSNGGTNVSSVTQNYNTELNKPGDPTKVGYTFVGWYSNVGLTTEIIFPYMMPELNTTLYAKWQVNAYTITFNSNGGSNVSSITKNYNETITSPVSPTRTSFVFDGWYTDEIFSSKYVFSKMPANDITLYAKWIEEHTVYFEYNNGLEETTKVVLDNKVIGTLPTPTRVGYTFNGWYYNTDFSGAKVLTTDIVTNSLTLYASWDVKTITLSFNSNGGTNVASITQNYNSIVDKPIDPTKIGYSFVGWYSDSLLNNQVAFPYNMPSVNTTFYAKWQVNTYTISFDSNGGSSISPITKIYNETITAPVSPTRTSFIFDGWYTDEIFSSKFVFSKMPANDITLYAKWIAENTVSFEYNNGEIQTTKTVLDNTAIGTLPIPTRVGYTFNGWYYNIDFSGARVLSSDIVNGPLTLFAKWDVKTITLSFDSNGGTNVASITQDFNSSILKPIDPTKIGYTFVGWYSDSLLNNQVAFPYNMPSVNTTIYAKWQVNTYTISFESNGGSSISSITKIYNETITAPVSPTRTSFIFDGWYTDEIFSSKFVFSKMPANDLTLYAKWIAENTVYFEYNNGEIQTTKTVLDNTAIGTLPIPTRVGYTFNGWYYNINFSGAIVLSSDIVNGPLTLFAKWDVKTITLSFDSNGGTNVASITQDFNSSILKPIDPTKTGYTFVGWYSDALLNNAISFPYNMPSVNTTIYAKWQVNTYTISFDSNGGSSINPIIKNFDEVVDALSIPTKSGYVFDGWYQDNNTFINEYTFTKMPANNVTLYAKWTKEHTVTFKYNNGENQTTKTILDNITIGTLPTPIRVGYTFNGWYRFSDFSGSKVLESDIINSSITLYAKWDINLYNISFYVDGVLYSQNNQDYNTSITYPNIPTKEGYIFDGWYTSTDSGVTLDNKFTESLIPANNVSVYAKWIIQSFIVTFDSVGGSIHNPITSNYNSNITLPVPTKTGYTFTGWYETSNYSTNGYFNTYKVTKDITLYANWELVGANDTSLKEIQITSSDNTVIKTVSTINNVMTVYVNNSIDIINIIPVALYPSTLVNEINGLSLEVGKTYENEIILTSLSGKTKTYVLNVIRDTDPEITDILLNQNFDINFDGSSNYSLDVAIDITNLEVNAFTNHEKNKVSINGVNIVLYQLSGKRSISLNSPGTKTNIIVVVTSLSGSLSKTYTITINRSSKSNNANLVNLSISGNSSFIGDLKQKITGIDGFNQAVNEYTVNVNYEDTSLIITPVFPTGASASITGNTDLKIGQNKVIIEVVAEDKINKVTYTIEVYRASPSTNAFIQSVQLKDITKNQIVSNQNIILNDINIFNVGYDVLNVVLIPTKDSNSQKATIVDLGTLSLNEGINDFVLVVIAEDGITVSEYDIRIIRANGNTSNKLASLSVSGLELNPIVDLDNVFNYELLDQLSYATTSLNIEAIKVDPSYGYVTVSFEGSPIKTNTLTINPPIGESNLVITVYPEKGLETKYNIKIIRKNITGKSELSSLIVKDNENKDLILNPNFNILILDYTLSNVKYSISTLKVIPTAVNEASISSFKVNGSETVSSGSTYDVNLSVGQNIIEIVVVSNSNQSNTKTYTITVTRLDGDSNNDGIITSTIGNLSSVGNIYTLVLPKAATSFRLDVSKSSPNSKVYISGDNATYKHFDFSTINSTVVSVIITSETGIDNIFTVNVTRSSLSNNAELLNLTIKGTTSKKESVFTSFPVNYTVDYKDSYVEFKAIFVEFGGTIDKLGASLKVGMNNILLAATAADGQTYKLYNINITRKAPSSNNLLESIILSNPTDTFIQYPLNEVFSSGKTNYTANVNYEINKIVINPKTIEDGASYIIINSTGVLSNTVNLVEGLNDFNIVVTAEDGSTNSYSLSIIQQASNKDATLSDLTITDNILNFSSNKFRYPDVDYIYYSSEIGSIELFAKTNALTSNIKIKFNGKTSTYLNQASLNINLQIGANIVEIIVTSEGNTTNTYTLYIFKSSTTSQLDIYDIVVEGVKDANKDKFKLCDINNNEVNFDVNNLNYYVQIPFEYNDVIINPQVLNSIVEQVSYRESLIPGSTIEISFVVKSEDLNNSNTYTVYVTQEEGDKDNSLLDLQLEDLDSNQYINDFDKDTTFYNVEIGKSKDYVTVRAITSSLKARVEIQDADHNPLTGNIKINNITDIIVLVYSENGEVKTYIIRVTKTQISDNPFLASITIKDQLDNDLTLNLNPSFSSNMFTYNLIVDYKVNEINITGEGVDKAVIISGSKTTNLKTLSEINLIELVSKAEDGQTATYTILVYRMLPSITSKLKNINVGDETVTILKDVYDYTIDVPYLNDKTILDIIPEDVDVSSILVNSKPLKDSEYSLVLGANTFLIEVTAEDGLTKSNYQLIINRKNASSDVKLIDLEVDNAVGSNFKEKTNEGEFIDTTFKESNYVQYIFVTSRDERITLRPKILDTCKVKNQSDELTIDLNFGNNVVPITVIAEDDKTELNYVFIINRPSLNKDTSLKSLTVNNSKFEKINEEVYIVDLSSNINQLDLSVILTDSNATYEIIGNEKLEFQSIVTVKVTAEDGVTTQNYVLYITEGEETVDELWKIIGLIAIGLSIAFATSLYMVRKTQY